MKILRRLAILLMLAPILTPVAQAQDLPAALPDPMTDTLSDFAGVLYGDEEARITQLLTETRETTGIHMVVVTVPGIASQGGEGMRIEDYSKALFNAWGIGDTKRNDGILILLDTESREARIALGAGYDPVYDGRAARVLSTALLPELREGRMAAGIQAAILSTRERLITPFLAGEVVTESSGFEDESTGFPFGLIFVGIFAFLGFRTWRSRRISRTCPSCAAVALTRKRETITVPTQAEPGTGLQHLTCTSCGFIDRQSYVIPYSYASAHDPNANTGSSNHDSGGFGGGSSDGGGASGKW
ncbi:COG1512 Beta-propeller domains of methanol dehydrogenase type [Paracoccaceae bacterium]